MSFVSKWVGLAFSDNGSPSSSRLLTAVHVLVACGCLIYSVYKNPVHAIPDGMTLTGLGAFSTAHYAVNKISTSFGKDTPSKTDVVIPKI